MKNIIFENHERITSDIPIIFHRDHLNDGVSLNFANEKITDLYYEKSCPVNWHDNIELLYVIRGNALFVCGGKEIPAKAGDILIASSNKLHCLTSNEPVCFYCLIIDCKYCTSNGVSITDICFNEKSVSKKTEEQYLKLVERYNSDSDFREIGLRCAVLELIYTLCTEEKNDIKVNSVTKASETIKRAVYYINEHFNEKIRIDDICENINISKYHFIREFRKETKRSPVDYINYIRCERAKEMISEGMFPGDACGRCGFDDQSYFAKVFKKYIGMLPSEYSKYMKSVNDIRK